MGIDQPAKGTILPVLVGKIREEEVDRRKWKSWGGG
jgi:hypothetical protein